MTGFFPLSLLELDGLFWSGFFYYGPSSDEESRFGTAFFTGSKCFFVVGLPSSEEEEGIFYFCP